MDPDVLVLISEGLSTGELNWDLLDISQEMRRILKDMLANADPSRTEDVIAVDLAHAAFLESDSHVELSSEERSAEANKTTSGTRAADVEADRASRAAQVGCSRKRPSQEEAGSRHVRGRSSSVSRSASQKRVRSSSLRRSPSASRPGKRPRRPAEDPAFATRGSRSSSSRRGGSRESSVAAPGDSRTSSQDGEHLEMEVEVVESSRSVPAPAESPPALAVQAPSASGASSSKGKSRQKPKGRWARSQPSTGPPARAGFSGAAAKSSSDSSLVVPSRKSSRVVESSDEDAVSSSTLSPPSEQVHVDSGASLEWFPDTGSEAENLVVGSVIELPEVVPTSSSLVGLPDSESSGAAQGVDAEPKETPPAPPKTQTSHRQQRRRPFVPRQPVSQRPLAVPSPVRGQQPLVRFSKQVAKWDVPYIEPPFTRPGALKCWTQMLNARLPAPLPRDLRILSSPEGIAAFADYKNPDHPWQKLRRRLPSRACLFDTSEFDPDSKVSQRASPMTRVMGYWSNFRGSGDSENVDLGFSLWERDHWILPKAVETTFSAIAADLDMMDWTAARKTRTRKDLDALKAAWSRYVVERNKRSDRLRAKVVPYIWKWGSSQDPGFSEVKPEFMLEPTMPGYSLEYLPWEPKTVEWLSEIAALDAAEPWRNGWIDVPE
ncbi:hypothetical protein ON010_g8864 [Phytophthora cinnamomi]|nr:hypothetical protein ON010_g8864 [Phytophthora cinnamomi]